MILKTRGWLPVCCCLLLALAAGASAPAHAQDPVGGALATLAAATSQAQARQWQAAQQATRQAQSLAATSQAQQTQAQATRQAIDAQATRQAIEAEATQASLAADLNATATAHAHTQSAQATRAALDAQATVAAYNVALETSRRQAEVGIALLWIAAALAIAGTGYMIITWAKRNSKPAPQASTVVIDVAPVALFPAPKNALQVQVINDTTMNDAIRRWWDAQSDSMESSDE